MKFVHMKWAKQTEQPLKVLYYSVAHEKSSTNLSLYIFRSITARHKFTRNRFCRFFHPCFTIKSFIIEFLVQLLNDKCIYLKISKTVKSRQTMIARICQILLLLWASNSRHKQSKLHSIKTLKFFFMVG